MPRSPRLDYPGARHHVMNRAGRRTNIFAERGARLAFLATLQELPERYGLRVHGYVLMPNHFHLMVESAGGSLSVGMQHLTSVFAQAANREHSWDGAVFRGRFRSQLVESDAYWMHLLAYLHLNPVKARFARKPQDWDWSSHNAYTGRATPPPWLERDELLRLFDGERGIERYVTAYARGQLLDPEDFKPDRLWARPVPAAARARLLAPVSVMEAVVEVARVVGEPEPTALLRCPCGRPAPAVWLATWWAWRRTGRTLSELAVAFEVSPQRVRGRVRQLVARSAVDPVVAGWVQALVDAALAPGQALDAAQVWPFDRDEVSPFELSQEIK